MPPINKPTDVDVELAKIRRELDELRAGSISSQDGSVVLPPGTSLAVVAADGTILGYLGAFARVLPDGTNEQGTLLYRHGGGKALSVAFDGNNNDPYRQTVSLWSIDGAQVIGDDGYSGSGLARPYVPIGVQRANLAEMPRTASASFVDLELGDFYKQHPKALVNINCGCDTSGTTGEVRVLLDDVQVGGTIALAFAVGVNVLGPFTVPGAHMSTHRIRIQARRTLGTGNACATATALGVQS